MLGYPQNTKIIEQNYDVDMPFEELIDKWSQIKNST